MSEQRVLRKIAFSWGVILINGIQNTEKPKASYSVLRNHKVLASLGTIFVFIIPVLFLVFVNTHIWMVSRRHKKRLHIVVQAPGIRPDPLENTEQPMRSTQPDSTCNRRAGFSLTKTIKQEIKTFKTFLIVIGFFVVC